MGEVILNTTTNRPYKYAGTGDIKETKQIKENIKISSEKDIENFFKTQKPGTYTLEITDKSGKTIGTLKVEVTTEQKVKITNNDKKSLSDIHDIERGAEKRGFEGELLEVGFKFKYGTKENPVQENGATKTGQGNVTLDALYNAIQKAPANGQFTAAEKKAITEKWESSQNPKEVLAEKLVYKDGIPTIKTPDDKKDPGDKSKPIDHDKVKDYGKNAYGQITRILGSKYDKFTKDYSASNGTTSGCLEYIGKTPEEAFEKMKGHINAFEKANPGSDCAELKNMVAIAKKELMAASGAQGPCKVIIQQTREGLNQANIALIWPGENQEAKILSLSISSHGHITIMDKTEPKKYPDFEPSHIAASGKKQEDLTGNFVAKLNNIADPAKNIASPGKNK